MVIIRREEEEEEEMEGVDVKEDGVEDRERERE